MTKMAGHLTVARKAVRLIRQIEDKLKADMGTMTKAELVLASKEIGRLADIAAKKSSEAVKILKAMKPKVEKYRKELQNAVD
jgi:phage-related protein